MPGTRLGLSHGEGLQPDKRYGFNLSGIYVISLQCWIGFLIKGTGGKCLSGLELSAWWITPINMLFCEYDRDCAAVSGGPFDVMMKCTVTVMLSGVLGCCSFVTLTPHLTIAKMNKDKRQSRTRPRPSIQKVEHKEEYAPTIQRLNSIFKSSCLTSYSYPKLDLTILFRFKISQSRATPHYS